VAIIRSKGEDLMLPSKKILSYEMVGIAFIIFLGSAFHFTYELSGRFAFVGAFSAVNESVWEHLKLAFWPSLIWLLIEYLPINKLTNNFVESKTIGTCTMIALIPIVFYSYTSITGESIFAIDISTYVVAVVVGQIVSYTLFKKNQFLRNTDKVALVILIVLGITFTVFTFYPPHLPIFQDPISSGYGIAT
jgi:hypothetical protein